MICIDNFFILISAFASGRTAYVKGWNAVLFFFLHFLVVLSSDIAGGICGLAFGLLKNPSMSKEEAFKYILYGVIIGIFFGIFLMTIVMKLLPNDKSSKSKVDSSEHDYELDHDQQKRKSRDDGYNLELG